MSLQVTIKLCTQNLQQWRLFQRPSWTTFWRSWSIATSKQKNTIISSVRRYTQYHHILQLAQGTEFLCHWGQTSCSLLLLKGTTLGTLLTPGKCSACFHFPEGALWSGKPCLLYLYPVRSMHVGLGLYDLQNENYMHELWRLVTVACFNDLISYISFDATSLVYSDMTARFIKAPQQHKAMERNSHCEFTCNDVRCVRLYITAIMSAWFESYVLSGWRKSPWGLMWDPDSLIGALPPRGISCMILPSWKTSCMWVYKGNFK